MCFVAALTCDAHMNRCVFSELQKGRLIRTYDLVGVEIKIDSMVNDGTRPWVVISVISRVLNGTSRSVLWIAPNKMRVDEHIQSTRTKASHQGVGVESLGSFTRDRRGYQKNAREVNTRTSRGRRGQQERTGRRQRKCESRPREWHDELDETRQG